MSTSVSTGTGRPRARASAFSIVRALRLPSALSGTPSISNPPRTRTRNVPGTFSVRQSRRRKAPAAAPDTSAGRYARSESSARLELNSRSFAGDREDQLLADPVVLGVRHVGVPGGLVLED